MKRKSTSFATCFCLCILLTTNIFAIYDCFVILTHKQEFKKAKAVFVGKLVKVETIKPEDRPEKLASEFYAYLTFEVEQSWKGKKRERFSGWVHATHLFNNEWEFEEGRTYLIYARKFDGVYIVGEGCTRTRPLENATEEQQAEFKELDKF